MAVLAVIIVVAAAFSSPRSDENGQTTLIDPIEQSQKLYEEAITALESGDTTLAASLLTTVVELDPSNTAAGDALAQLTDTQAGDDETPDDPDDETPDDDDGDSGFTDPVDDLAVLLPDEVAGFSMGTAVRDEGNIEISLDPAFGGDGYGLVSSVQLSVHDRETITAASAFIGSVSVVAYPSDTSSIVIDGADGRFGTDGAGLANAVFVRGRYVFEVTAGAASGDPSGLKSLVSEIARTFPDIL